MVGSLIERIRLVERENAQLKKEVEFFRRTLTLAQGLKGETLIANLTGGVRTGYKDPHDVTIKSGDRLEVKYSHVNVPGRSKTKRWNWHSVLGAHRIRSTTTLYWSGRKILGMRISIRPTWLACSSWYHGRLSTTSRQRTISLSIRISTACGLRSPWP